ncbi:MAG: DUF58 domain-containing protein [Planctomycetes bacterium]|nr:DUF58 domain-containing protein [Planctomycetota bacterium]
MPRPRSSALELAQRWKLALDRTPPRGPAGERLGRGTGSSLEFQDRRAYSVGDDVRHVDWRALARTDQVLVRLWREEVLARVEIVVDASRSMAIAPEKEQLAVDLTALLARAALEAGAQPAVVRLDARPRLVALDELDSKGLEFDGRAPLLESTRAASSLFRNGAVQIVLSDFLSPHDATELVRPLGARAGALALVQVLTPDESLPPVGVAQRLIDCETDEALDLVLDAPTVAAYCKRLQRLTDALDVEARRARGRFVQLSTAHSLESICRERLAREGLLTPSN